MANNPSDIETRVREALRSDPRTMNTVIDVDYEQGVIVLRGEAGSLNVFRAAEEIARNQNGVNEVMNRLKYE